MAYFLENETYPIIKLRDFKGEPLVLRPKYGLTSLELPDHGFQLILVRLQDVGSPCFGQIVSN